MDAARKVAKLAKAVVEMFPRPVEDAPRRGPVMVQTLVQDRELERGRHKPLLRAVVQIALDAPPCLVGRRDEPRPRRGQFLARFGVFDRLCNELGEGGNAVLGPCGHPGGVGPRRRYRAPQPPA